MKVYLDNGATTRVDQKVIDEMNIYQMDKYGNASSLHRFGQEANKALEESRKIIAQKINALSNEIIFTSGGTESDNLAIKGIAYANKDKGNHIITTSVEHHAIMLTCKELEKEGCKVTYLKVDREGFITDLQKHITPKTILVSIIHANNEIGTIQDLEKIGSICKEHDIIFHTDAVQSFTKVPIDVKNMNISMLSASSHKIHGPKGIGFLYIKKGTKIQKLIDGGSQEFNMRAGTENVAGAVGFAKAVELSTYESNSNMIPLRDRLMDGLLKIPNTHLNGPKKERLCNNASISFHYVEGESLLMMLSDLGIAVSTGSACSSKSLEPSHVLLAIGLKHEIAHGTIRFTLSRFTTKEEIDYTINAVKESVEKLRKFSPLHS